MPLAVLGGLGLQAARGFPNDVFCRVGLVMLVGLASKNAILIVEFAEQLCDQAARPKTPSSRRRSFGCKRPS